MGDDAANIAGSVARSTEVERSPNTSQRASEMAQDQLAGESIAAMGQKKTDEAEQVRRERIRQDRERRRRQMERDAGEAGPDSTDEEGDGPLLDVVA